MGRAARRWPRPGPGCTGLPVPPDPPPRAAEPPGLRARARSSRPVRRRRPPPASTRSRRSRGVRRPAAPHRAPTEHPGRFRLLVAAESAGALIGAEMGHAGLPWRADVHDELLRELLGAAAAGRAAAPAGRAGRRDQRGVRRARAAPRLAGRGAAGVRPGRRRRAQHPGLGAAQGRPSGGARRCWSTRSSTASGRRTAGPGATRGCSDGRFRPEYVPGGVVSGRWATRGGGALQIPKVVRRAVVADPGWRVRGRRRRPAGAAGAGRGLRRRPAGRGRRRRRPLRGAGRRLVRRRPGQGQGRPARRDVRADRRRRDPGAGRAAAQLPDRVRVRRGGRPHRRGRRPGPLLARPHLPARRPTAWRDAGLDPPEEAGSAEASQGGASGRARGRFTRNFVIQATAAEWALVLLATLRTALEGTKAELVLLRARRGGRALPRRARPTRWPRRCTRAPTQAGPAAVRRDPGPVPARRLGSWRVRRREVNCRVPWVVRSERRCNGVTPATLAR